MEELMQNMIDKIAIDRTAPPFGQVIALLEDTLPGGLGGELGGPL